MAKQVVLIDPSILIDYYRKTDKMNSAWMSFIQQGYDFAISTITKYEIFTGANEHQIVFWQSVLDIITVIPFDEHCVDAAIRIKKAMKKKRKKIDNADLFIAATVVTHQLTIATLNKKHFERIDELTIIY